MFFDGDKNSVPVGVCGTSVPDVWDVLDVVPADELEVVECVVVVVTEEVVVVVDEEFEEDGLLEQAARARAHTGRTSSRTDHVRSARRIERVYDEPPVKWGFQPIAVPPERQWMRAGTVPITDARSMERRCGQ
jgi:hypothetical protein